jgi:predicted PurR-regulated permease PerM
MGLVPPGNSAGKKARAMANNAEERFGKILFYGAILLLMYFVYRIFEPFLVPLGWAGVFAIVFYSWNRHLEQRMGRTFAASLSTVGVTLILIVPVLLVMTLFVHQGIETTRSVQASIATGEYGVFGRVWAWIASQVAAHTSVDLPALVRQETGKVGEYLASKVGTVVHHIVVFVFEVFVTLFALFFFFRDGDAILNRVRRLLPFEETTRERILAEARDLIFASVVTSLLIAAIQGVVCGGAFAIVGVKSAVFWGVVMAFLSLLPVVGPWPIWVPAAIWLFSTGHLGRALLLVGMCSGVHFINDSILRPMLVGGRTSLNALLVFISVLGGIAVFGMLGVVLGPVVVATAFSVLDVYTGKAATGNTAGASK